MIILTEMNILAADSIPIIINKLCSHQPDTTSSTQQQDWKIQSERMYLHLQPSYSISKSMEYKCKIIQMGNVTVFNNDKNGHTDVENI